METFKRANLTLKLFLSYVILVVFPFFISSFVLSSTSSENIQKNTTSYINLFAEQLSSTVEKYIGELDRMTRVLTLDETLCDILTSPLPDNAVASYNYTQYLQTEILKMMTQQPSIRNITFIGENGLLFCGPNNNIANKSSFFEITQTDSLEDSNRKMYLSAAHIPTYLLLDFSRREEPVFTLTRPLYSENQKVGTVVLTVTCQNMLDAININPSLLESGARIVVTNKDNKIIADTSADFVPNSLSDSSYITFTVSENELEQKLYFSDTGKYLNSTVIIDKNQLFKSTIAFNRIAIMLILFLIVGIILLSAYFSRKLVHPLKLLRNATNKFASGNYSVRIPVTSNDEIGDLCSSFNFMTEQTQDLLDRVYHYQIATKQAQLEALQNQISPHFLHNTLEIIRMKALINKDKEVAVMVQTLAKLFRITLDRTSNIVKIRDELEHVETYLTIQNMRFNNRYKFTNLVPEEFLDYSIIKLTLQPLVENAIKHGFSRTFGDEEIQIRAQADDNDLIIQVIDNGVGILPENLDRIHQKLDHLDTPISDADHNSIGIINISDRIRLEYGEGYFLKIHPNLPRGTIVELRIPMNYNLEMVPDLD